MKLTRVLSVFMVIFAALFFLVPLFATFNFSLRMERDQLSFAAYRSVLESNTFIDALSFSALASLLAILFGILLVVPTAYWVRLKLPAMRPVTEFLSLMPLIIPPVVLVFGYVRIYGTDSFLPLTMTQLGTNALLVVGYVVLSLPYMYRAVDNGMAAIDIGTLTEAAESLGASRARTVTGVIFPNVRSAIVSGAFLTFSISLGEFVITSLLSRPGFGPYMVQIGQDYAYQPAAIAIMAFAFTWVCMALMAFFATRKPGQGILPGFLKRAKT
ncbi:ABC transporter permease [Paracoccus sp. SCSIO 75233]|uniref:ABC transporter permease n=1 Tax=Paracoccus sp. SCSIO 75233 TaxID=3017782 RepID=UPI0022EFDB79|nr:ABC transporter permease subunit [Paracoccus sp. SCSIO 75233]WBU54473.1 ABC transporter permease subunit [Paracoccus sp. SCSIO 75233]